VWCGVTGRCRDGWVSSGLGVPPCLPVCGGVVVVLGGEARRRTSRQHHGCYEDKKIKKETLEAVPRS